MEGLVYKMTYTIFISDKTKSFIKEILKRREKNLLVIPDDQKKFIDFITNDIDIILELKNMERLFFHYFNIDRYKDISVVSIEKMYNYNNAIDYYKIRLHIYKIERSWKDWFIK